MAAALSLWAERNRGFAGAHQPVKVALASVASQIDLYQGIASAMPSDPPPVSQGLQPLGFALELRLKPVRFSYLFRHA